MADLAVQPNATARGAQPALMVIPDNVLSEVRVTTAELLGRKPQTATLSAFRAVRRTWCSSLNAVNPELTRP